jgi:hypothetical protein
MVPDRPYNTDAQKGVTSNYVATYVRGVGHWNLLVAANVGDNLLGVFLASSLESVEVYDSVAVITAVATTVVVVSAHGLLIKGLLVVVVAAKYRLILLAELGSLLL